MEKDDGGKEGKCHQGTCIKDTWMKTKGVGSRVGDGDAWGKEHDGVRMETTVLEQ